MSAIEDGAMQNQAVTHIDDLDCPLTLTERLMISDDADCCEAADALEAQAARVKELEEQCGHRARHQLQQANRIAALEAQLEAFREAAKPIDKWLKHLAANGSRRLKDDEYPAIFGCPNMGKLRALMSALRNTETKQCELTSTPKN